MIFNHSIHKTSQQKNQSTNNENKPKNNTSNCNSNDNGISISISESVANIQEMVALLNEYGSNIGTFSVNPDGINIDVRFAEGLTKLLSCGPGGIVSNTYNI